MKINNYEVIPFDVEKFKAGWKPICRNGFEPKEVHYFETARSDCKTIFVDNTFTLRNNGPIGKYYNNEDSDYDLFLIVPEPPARYVVEYEVESGAAFITQPFINSEDAFGVAAGYGYKILATYKLVKI
jgi:hypothetical protein